MVKILKIKLLLLTVVLMGGKDTLFAQQVAQYSQYMFNQLYINPAYAGYKEQWSADAYYRSQWNDLEGGPRSFSAAVDGTVYDDRVGLGLSVASDKLGPQKNVMGYLNYAYRLLLNEDNDTRLAFGIGAGVVQLGVDRNALQLNDPDPAMMSAATTTVVPDARAGIFYSNQYFFAGFSVDNLLASLNENAKQKAFPMPKPHLFLTAGMLARLNDNFYLRPQFLLKDDTRGPTSLDLDAFLIYKEMLWLGAAYRTGVKIYKKEALDSHLENDNAATILLELFPAKTFRIGYAYELRTGPLKGYTGSTHEFSVAYYFPKKHKINTKDLNCPKLF